MPEAHPIASRKAGLNGDEVQITRVIGTDDPTRAERYQSDGEKSSTRVPAWCG
jgi:hypothetical protein